MSGNTAEHREPNGMAYSEDWIAEALTALAANDGNVKQTARQLGVGRSTLSKWRDQAAAPANDRQAALPQKVALKRDPLADRLEALAHTLLDDLVDDVRRIGKVNEVSTAIAIAVDKARLLRGESTQITETRNVDEVRDLLTKRINRLNTTQAQA